MNDPMIMTVADSAIDGLRRQVDAIDDAVHDLLMQRTELTARIGALKARGGPATSGEEQAAFLRPAREAMVLRRLVRRHRGALPKGTLVRIWRELMSAVVRLQGPFAVAVLAPERQAGLWDLARDHFGSLTPMAACETSAQVLRAIVGRQATVGVLPRPRPGDPEPWWSRLVEADPGMPLVFARLPFAGSGTLPGGPTEALAVGLVPMERTSRDRSLFVIETQPVTGPAELAAALESAGLDVADLFPWQGAGQSARLAWVELEGFVPPDDARLGRLPSGGAGELRRLWPIGGYALPLSPAELAGSAG